MARVTWTDQALEDLEAVCQFIARDTPRYADLLASRAFEATQGLGEFPRLGRIVPELGRGDIREVMVQGYRIIYRLAAEEVQILTVHHGARPLGGLNPPGSG